LPLALLSLLPCLLHRRHHYAFPVHASSTSQRHVPTTRVGKDCTTDTKLRSPLVASLSRQERPRSTDDVIPD
jgi:hypothetical protein